MKKLKSKDWTSFTEFINTANANCNWVVLRNHEFLPNNFFGNDKDVDILCEDIESFVKVMGLTKRSYGVGAYQTVIEEKTVPFDVRFLGDGYYDKLWQCQMLKNKVFTEDCVPMMSDKDYFYSLIYHAKLQKFEVKELYKERFFKLASNLSIKDYTLDSINNDTYIASLLSNFMHESYFTYTTPLDKEIPKNLEFFRLLSDFVKQEGCFYSPPIPPNYTRYIPKLVVKLVPKKGKELIKGILSNAS